MSNPSLRAGEISLKDAVCFVVDNRGKTVPVQDEGIPLISTACISNEMLFPLLNTDRYVSDEIYENWFRSHPEPGDVILTNKGSKNGEVCLVPDPVSFCIAQDMVALRANRDLIDPGYLLVALRSRIVQERIKSLNVDSVIPHFKKTDFDKLFIPLPSRAEQQFIGGLYLDLSRRIELNRKTIETLEAMAKALFKSWFVDFDPVKAKAEGRPTGLPAEISDLFPESFEDSELGEIPSGWELEALGKILDVDKGVSYKGDFLSDTEGLPMVNLGCFAGGGAFRAEKMKFYAGEYRERHLASAGDLLVANTDMTQNRIILGAPIIVPSWRGRDKFLFSHHTFAIRFRRSKSAFTRFIYFTLLKPSFRQVAAGHATGTTVLALPKDGITDYQTVIPPAGLLNVFAAKVEALYQKCQALTEQSELLAKTRDALLPKLISGEIRIPDAEKVLEEVGV
jgi:type I restriction enzyme S subunit